MIARPSRRDVLRYGSAAAASLLPAPAIAEAWPSKPIRIVCGYPAGRLTDIFGRGYRGFIFQKTRQPGVVEEQASAPGALPPEPATSPAPHRDTPLVTTAAANI